MSSEGPSTLAAHLAEMDRLLRDIQAELLPDREPAPGLADAPASTLPAAPDPPAAPAAPTPAPAAVQPPASEQQIHALTDVATRLVASMRELLAGYERLVTQVSAAPRSPRRRVASAPADAPSVTLAAGAFPSLQALREFEQAVSRLPGVREAAVQAYEGTDRAIIEVHLDHPSP